MIKWDKTLKHDDDNNNDDKQRINQVKFDLYLWKGPISCQMINT